VTVVAQTSDRPTAPRERPVAQNPSIARIIDEVLHGGYRALFRKIQTPEVGLHRPWDVSIPVLQCPVQTQKVWNSFKINILVYDHVDQIHEH